MVSEFRRSRWTTTNLLRWFLTEQSSRDIFALAALFSWYQALRTALCLPFPFPQHFFFGLALLEPWSRVICELFHLASLFHKVSWRKLWSLSWYTFKKKIKDAYNMWAVQYTVSLRFPFIFFRVRILIELTWLLGGAFQNKTSIDHSPVLSTASFLRKNSAPWGCVF